MASKASAVLIGRKLCSEYLRSLRSAPFVAGTIFKFTATKVQNSTFKYPTGQDFSVEFGLKSLDTMMRVGSIKPSHQSNLSCTCQFPHFIALCDHNPPTLQIHRWTSCSYHKCTMLSCNRRQWAWCLLILISMANASIIWAALVQYAFSWWHNSLAKSSNKMVNIIRRNCCISWLIQSQFTQWQMSIYKCDVRTSLQRNSRMLDRSTFLPSAVREYGVLPAPFSWTSHLSFL